MPYGLESGNLAAVSPELSGISKCMMHWNEERKCNLSLQLNVPWYLVLASEVDLSKQRKEQVRNRNSDNKDENLIQLKINS